MNGCLEELEFPSAKRSCLIIRDILGTELENLGDPGKLEIWIAFRIIVLYKLERFA